MFWYLPLAVVDKMRAKAGQHIFYQSFSKNKQVGIRKYFSHHHKCHSGTKNSRYASLTTGKEPGDVRGEISLQAIKKLKLPVG